MKAIFTTLLVAVIGFGFTMQDAEAKRFGGGLSFGGKKSFSAPFKRSAPSKQTAPAAPGKKAPGAAASGSGAKSGLMGALGGLAIGGLLGAMFFGGAFENINFFDILVFGLIAFLLFKFLGARRRTLTPQAAGGAPAPDANWGEVKQGDNVHQRANSTSKRGFDTDIMFKDKVNTDAPQHIPSGFVAITSLDFPKDFDQNQFLEGAKNAFTMLQAAWDHGELADIRGLTTDKVFGEIQDQFFDRQGENKTEVLEATAEIIDFAETDNDQDVAVLFNVNMREIDAFSGPETEAHWVQEVWHFTKPKNAIKPTWFVDGVQQVED
jgi:predicted lipid-binding transport protein (Tim44 family)